MKIIENKACIPHQIWYHIIMDLRKKDGCKKSEKNS